MFKKANIVILPSNKKANIGEFIISMYKEKGFINGNPIYNKLNCGVVIRKGEIEQEDQYLYIISNEKIEDNDIYLDDFSNTIVEANINSDHKYYASNCHKIIASTDTSLNLPQLPLRFIQKYIEEYNKGNIITEVMVEYDEESLKVNSDNTITIQEIKTSWNRNELCINMQYYMEYCERNGYVTPMDWLDNYKHF